MPAPLKNIFIEMDTYYVGIDSNEKEFIFDKSDHNLVAQYYWRVGSNGYVESGVGGIIKLHRFLTNPTDGEIVDHRDRDPLNNQRYNLRICKRQQNSWNRRQPKVGRCGYIGVYQTSNNKYYARVKTNDKDHYSKRVDTKEEAALLYNIMVLELFGEYAQLNIIKGE